MTMTTTGILITDGCERHNDGVHESCHAHEVHFLGPEWNRRYSNDKGATYYLSYWLSHELARDIVKLDF